MDGSDVVEVWHLFREYIDKKSVAALSEKFIDLVADLGISDEELKEAYYLDLDNVDDDIDDEWED